MKAIRPLFVNPFEHCRDHTLFLSGLLAYVLSSIQVYNFVYVPDGIFQAHITDRVLWYSGFVNGAINILVPTVVLYLFGKIVYAKTRFFDVLNVMMIAQIVNYFIALLLLNPYSKSTLFRVMEAVEQGDIKLETISTIDIVLTSFGGMLAFLLILYFFYLLVVGMKIAMNSKKAVHTVLMILLVLLVDTILHVLHPYI